MSITAASLIMAVAGCDGQKNAPVREGSETDYAFSFFRNVTAVEDDDANVFVSPYSAGVALGMLADGAEGQTKEELLDALNGVDFSGIRFVQDSVVDVRSANSAWIRDGFNIKRKYVEHLSEAYDAKVAEMDFSDPATVGVINKWCSDNTEGKIPEIIDRISPDMQMFLMNALYFKAPWETAFNEKLTSENVFHGSLSDQTVPFMSSSSYLDYAEYQGCQLVELPYAGGRWSMFVLLPAEGMGPDTVISYLNENTYDMALGSLSKQKVYLYMPKFKIETTVLLNPVLSAMGVNLIFSQKAGLGAISESGIAVDEVKQKCFVEVNEAGSEAAAVTSIGIRTTALNPIEQRHVVMNVDRPFLFVIADKENDNILFAGRIMNLR